MTNLIVYTIRKQTIFSSYGSLLVYTSRLVFTAIIYVSNSITIQFYNQFYTSVAVSRFSHVQKYFMAQAI